MTGLTFAALVLVFAAVAIVLVSVRADRRVRAALQEARTGRRDAHPTLDQVEQLDSLNEMLVTLGRTKDPGLAFQGLARRVGRLVNCDRLGLAVLHENGHDVQIYLSRVSEPERRRKPRVETAYRLERSLFGQVIRSAESILVDDLASDAGDFADAAALVSQGFRSALILPLMSRNRAIGTLTAIGARPRAFTPAHRDALQPMAEVLAFAFAAQQQSLALKRYRGMETMAEVSLTLSTDIHSSLQAIIGQCGVIGTLAPQLSADVDVITSQAARISSLLDRMRATAEDQLRQAVAPAGAGAIPVSPEEILSDDL